MTSIRWTHGKVAFNNSWLTDERFRLWVEKGEDYSKTVCSLCNNAATDVAKIGVSALSLHTKGAKHQESFRIYDSTALLFFKKDQGSILCFFSDTTKADDGRIDTMMNCIAVFHAEICWVMKIVTFHFSYHSCLNMNSLVSSMFLNSLIAQSFRLSKTKCAY